jgi:hypothetical protein
MTAGDMAGLRWGGIGGIVFAVAFVVGVLMMTDTPEGDAPDREWVQYFDDSGNRWTIIAGAFVLALAVLGLLVFVSVLRERLRDGSPGTSWLSTAMLASGLTLVAMIGVAGAALAAVSAGIEIGESSVPSNADVPRTIEQVGFGALLVFGMAAGGLLIATASVAGGRAALLPRWLVVTGYVVAVIVMVGGVFFIPMVLLVLWVLTVSIVLLRQPSFSAP